MARIRGAPRGVVQRNFPDKDKKALAFQWLCENPTESPSTAANMWHIDKPASLQKKWKRHKDKQEREREAWRAPRTCYRKWWHE